MTSNTSATGGYLVSPSVVIEDDTLEDFMHDVLAGVTGFDPDICVRPRWQQEPTNLPSRNTDWLAFGIAKQSHEFDSYISHDSDGDGSDTEIRHETFDVACTFYGPNADGSASNVRDGLMIAQNREQLFLAGMGLVGFSPITRGPVLLKEEWLNRSDLTVTIRREIRRTYPILNLVSAPISVITEVGTFNRVAGPGE